MLVVVAFFLFSVFALLTIVDWVFALRRSPSLGHRLEAWSWKNPWLAAALLVVFGALLAHFFLNAWPPSGAVQLR